MGFYLLINISMTFKHDNNDGWMYFKRYFIVKTFHKSSSNV